MKRNNTSNEQNINSLVFEYEAMSQKGTVGFYEKTVFLKLIEHYFNEQLFDNALEVIEHAVNQHPFSGAFHLVQAQLYIEKNCESLALEALDKAILYAPSVFEVQILRAEALRSLGVFNEAFEILDDLLANATNEQQSEVYLSKALIFETMKQYKNMFIALKKSIIANPENTDALERIWFSVEMTQEYDESIKLHQELININPYSYIAWYNLGCAFSAKGDHKNARDAFEYAFIINDQFEFAYRECADSCIQLNKYKQALKCYDEFLEHFEGDADLFIKMGICHEALGDFEQAKSYFLKANSLEKNNDEVYFHLGICCLEQNKYEPAIAYFKKAILIDGLKEEYYVALAEVYFNTGDLDKAQSFFQHATEVAPETCACWTSYAGFLIKTGKNGQAMTVLNEAELYSFGPELMYCKVACFFSLDNRFEALSLLRKALKNHFDSHEYLFEVAPALKYDADIQTLIAASS